MIPPFEGPRKCGIPMSHSQPCKANRLAGLLRAGFALQCPFNSFAFSSAWEGTHCQHENELPEWVNASQGLWCWKYCLWKKHYPVRELKALRFWEECPVTQKGEKEKDLVFPHCNFIGLQNQTCLVAVRTLSDKTPYPATHPPHTPPPLPPSPLQSVN